MISGKSENLRGKTKKREGNFEARNLKVYSCGLTRCYNEEKAPQKEVPIAAVIQNAATARILWHFSLPPQ